MSATIPIFPGFSRQNYNTPKKESKAWNMLNQGLNLSKSQNYLAFLVLFIFFIIIKILNNVKNKPIDKTIEFFNQHNN